MNKINIRLAFLFCIFFVTSCAYEPIFSQKNYNIKLDKLTFSGEESINSIIKNQLSLFKKVEDGEDKFSQPKADDNAKSYSVNIHSELNEVIISKDTKGDPQKFEKIVKIILKVFHNNKIVLDKELENRYVYNNDSDKFKLEQSERIIIENLSQNITSEIVSSIINIDDS